MKSSTFFKTMALVVTGAAAVFVYDCRGVPDRSARHPLLVELQHMRTETQELLQKTSRQIDAIDPACTRLRKTVNELDARCRELAAEVDRLQQELTDREVVLRKYATLVEKDEGALLSDGTYISVATVRRQFSYEKDKHRQLKQLHQRRSTRMHTLDRLRDTAQRRLIVASRKLAALRQSQEQLGQQATQIAFLEQTFTDAGLSERSLATDVRRLQREIAAIQDRLDALSIGLPEILAIEESGGAGVSFVH